MNLYALLPLLAFFFSALLTIFLLCHQPRTLAKTLLALLCFETGFCQAAWCLTYFLPSSAHLLCAKIAYFSITFIPFTFYHFTAAYLERTEEKKAILAGYGMAVFLLLFLPTPFYIQGIRILDWGVFPVPGPLYLLFSFATLAASFRGLSLVFQEWKRSGSNPSRKNQMKYLFLGYGLYFSASIDFLLSYGVRCYPLESIFFLLSFVVMGYAVTRHHLLEIEVVITRTLVYSAMAAAISVAYLFSIFIFYSAFMAEGKARFFSVNFLAVLLIAIVLKPLEIFFSRQIERWVFKSPLTEIAEQKERLEAALERGERLQSVGILAAGMAHEIKNPLTAIKTFCEYLPVKYQDPEFREKFSRIVGQETERISTILRDLLLFSKPSEPCPEACDIGNLIENVVDLLSSDFIRNGITVHKMLEPSGAFVDPDQIKQVLLNLILNAVDAMKEAGRELTLRVRTVKNHCLIEVEDTGSGIEKEKIPYLFDPFYTDKEKGTGLGLAISHAIIQKNKGRIFVRSRPGEGSCFTMELPLAVLDAKPEVFAEQI